MDEQEGRFFTLCKRIWDDINPGELHQIKEYLKMMSKPKFGKANLEKVRNGVDLLPLLRQRELLGINNLSFIKKLLKTMQRDDLLKEVENYETESVKAADANPRRPKSDPIYASSDIRCHFRHLQQSIDTKNLEIQNKILYHSNISTILEKLTEDMEIQTDIIAGSETELTRLEPERKQKQKNAEKCRHEREQIDAEIKQLQKESREKWDLESSLRVDIDRMSQIESEGKHRISQSKCKNKDISKRYKDESEKKIECSQTINNLQSELQELEQQLKQISANLQYPPKHRPNSNENGSDLHSGAFSDITTDALPTETPNTIYRGYRKQHEPTPSSHNTDPTCNVVILISAEENAVQSSSFQDDFKKIQGEGTLTCESIVVRGELTQEFLNVTNDKIPQAKLVFILFSQVFVSNCWPKICEMKNLNSAIYDKKPLIVPVSAEQDTIFPMGMKSADNLLFHRRDAHYKEGLKKFVQPYIT